MHLDCFETYRADVILGMVCATITRNSTNVHMFQL